MKKILTFFLLTIIGFMPVVAAKGNDEIITPQTQLQKRQYQTRQYDGIEKAAIMKAMLNVLQDEGFIVNNANPTLGFISGSKDFSAKDKTIDITKEYGISKAKLFIKGIKVATVEATANVTEIGKEMKVRVNFKRKLLNVYGNPQVIEEITDTEYYQDFFAKVDKAIFIQKQKI